jgi:hypothetical protein
VWQSFRNYFITAQLIGGFSMAARLAVDGWKYAIYGTFIEHASSAIAWAIGGFLAVTVITVPYALMMAAIDLARLQRQPLRLDRR